MLTVHEILELTVFTETQKKKPKTNNYLKSNFTYLDHLVIHKSYLILSIDIISQCERVTTL